MAVKNIAVTDTLETFRTTFNDLALNDFGDIATLSGAISATIKRPKSSKKLF